MQDIGDLYGAADLLLLRALIACAIERRADEQTDVVNFNTFIPAQLPHRPTRSLRNNGRPPYTMQFDCCRRAMLSTGRGGGVTLTPPPN